MGYVGHGRHSTELGANKQGRTKREYKGIHTPTQKFTYIGLNKKTNAKCVAYLVTVSMWL